MTETAAIEKAPVDDWATDVAIRLVKSLEGGPYEADDAEKIASALRQSWTSAWQAGAAAEREACARIADAVPGDQEIGGENWTADAIAKQIRARSK